MVLTKSSDLLRPRCLVHFMRRLRHLVPAVRIPTHLRRLADLRSLVLSLDLASLGRLCTLCSHCRLVHRLERIITRHTSVVQIGLLLGRRTVLLRAHSAIIETP